MFNCDFPLRFLSTYEVRRPVVIIDVERETESLDYANADTHTVDGFLHEIEDSITATDGHIRQEEKRAVMTCYPDVDILKGDLIVDGGNVWLADETPNAERSPFTGWQPTVEVRCVAWQG